MKLVSFYAEGEERVGVLSADEKFVTDIASVIDGDFYDMVEFIEYATKKDLQILRRVAAKGGDDWDDYDTFVTKSVKLRSPIPWPIHDILCLGVNYQDHLEEARRDMKGHFAAPTHAVYFAKRASEILGPGDKIKGRFDLDPELDYEVELAVIIGKAGKDIPLEKAEDYVFGYSVFNDVSSRKIQKAHQQWFRGKSFDGYSVLGPCILTKDELPFPVAVDVISRVNGELRQSSNTSMLIHDIPHIIAELSAGMTLEPGDIIATGTPAGVGMGFSPPKYLVKGDTVTVEIPEIGKLTNKII